MTDESPQILALQSGSGCGNASKATFSWPLLYLPTLSFIPIFLYIPVCIEIKVHGEVEKQLRGKLYIASLRSRVCNNDSSIKFSLLQWDLAALQSRFSLLLSFIFVIRFSSSHCMFYFMNSSTISWMFTLLFFC